MKTRLLVVIASLLCCRCAAAPTGQPAQRGPTVPRVHPRAADGKPVTASLGLRASNAKFNQFGLYLRRVVDAVQTEWEGLRSRSNPVPPAGSYVIVRLVLDAKGSVPRIVAVDNHSTDDGARMCVSAITNCAPFGEWTEDMMKSLHPQGEELEFRFYYQ